MTRSRATPSGWPRAIRAATLSPRTAGLSWTLAFRITLAANNARNHGGKGTMFTTYQEPALPPYDRREEVRVQCQCRWCKHRWIEDGTVRAKRDYRGRRTVTLDSSNGTSHRCERVNAAIERALQGLGDRRATLGTPGKMTEEQYA